MNELIKYITVVIGDCTLQKQLNKRKLNIITMPDHFITGPRHTALSKSGLQSNLSISAIKCFS